MTLTQLSRPQMFTIDAPAPIKGTLLDTAKIVEGPVSWLDTAALGISYNCLPTGQVATFPCPVPDPLPEDKEFAGPEWINGFAFAVYAGIVCKSVGFDTAQANSELERVFAATETVGVARALMAYRFTGLAGAGGWDEPTTVTATVGKALWGLSVLEGHASWNYAGIPIIHMGRTVASLLMQSGVLELKGNTLYTKLGSMVAADGGYESPNLDPDGAETTDPYDTQWIYATGSVSLARSPAVQQEVLKTSTNEIAILRERMYVAAVDCYAAAVKVNVE